MNTNNNQPLISVIVPVYNVEQYLPRCLDSLIRQTYTNIEIIVVNDGSTDGSLAICREYAEKDKRIKVIDQQNKGLSGARNTGLKHYIGDYVSFVDSDDWVHRDMLLFMYNSIMNNNSDMSVCGSVKISEMSVDDINYNETAGFIYNQDEMMTLFLNGTYTACWSRLFKKEIINGIEFPEGLNCEDYIFMFHAICNLTKVSGFSHPMYYYYIRDNSICNVGFNIKKFDQFYSAKKQYELAKQLTPQYTKLSMTRLSGAIVSLVSRARELGDYKYQEDEIVRYLRHHLWDFLLNNKISIKIRILLAVQSLPRKLSIVVYNFLVGKGKK